MSLYSNTGWTNFAWLKACILILCCVATLQSGGPPIDAEELSNQPVGAKLSQNDLLKRARDRSEWETHEFNRFKFAGDASLNAQRYEEAVDLYDKALAFKFNELAAVGKARALLKMHRGQEALSLLKKLKGAQDESFWRLRLDCSMTDKNYAQALQTCDDLYEAGYPFGFSYLLRGEVCKAKGDTSAAWKSFQQGLWHCIRYRCPKQDFIDALLAMNVDPSTETPKNSSGNLEALKAIRELISMDHLVTERELHVLYNHSYNAVGVGGPGVPVNAWIWSCRDSEKPVTKITLNDRDNEFEIEISMDNTYLDLPSLREFGVLYNDEHCTDSRDIRPLKGRTPLFEGREGIKYLPCKNGYLSFRFGGHGLEQCEGVIRHFDTATATTATVPAAVKETTLTTSSSSSGSSLLTEGATKRIASKNEDCYKLIDKLLRTGKLSEAEDMIEARWLDAVEMPNLEEKCQTLERLIKLLITSKRDSPGIQKYLERACLPYITQDIQVKKLLGKELPTDDDYKLCKWHVFGSMIDPSYPGAHFVIWADTYPGLNIKAGSNLFKILCQEIGPEHNLDTYSGDVKSPDVKLLNEAWSQSPM